MDKKNLILGVLCLVGFFVTMTTQWNQNIEQANREAERRAAQTAEAPPPDVTDAPAPATTTDNDAIRPLLTPVGDSAKDDRSTPAAGDSAEDSIFSKVEEAEHLLAEAAVDEAPEKLYVLENEFIRVTFTSRGGAIRQVEFIHQKKNGELDYPDTLRSDQPYAFNVDDRLPVLAIGVAEGQTTPEKFAETFKMVKQTASLIQFVYRDPSGVLIIRGYQLEPVGGEGEPYSIKHETEFVNEGDGRYSLDLFVNLGAVPPTKGDIYGGNLNFGYFANGKAEFIDSTKLLGSPGVFLGFGKRAPIWEDFGPKDAAEPLTIQWASIKNQFFAGVLTPHSAQPASGFFIDTVKMDSVDEKGEPEYAMRGLVRFNFDNLPAGERKLFAMDYYVGPKEYSRLQAMGEGQDKVMQLAPDVPVIRNFAVISKLLLSLMLAINSFITNWGLTIIVVTIIIKGAMWPLTAIQVRSAKRMSKIQAPLQAIREKYKDNPQALQKKTMDLFRQNKVNPAAGCLPLFIQLPIFLSLFYTLRTASELRFAEFLWVKDLASADTISWLPDLPAWIPFFGGPIHILPLIMAVTMVFQMRMTPTPTTDNMQRKIFQLMPVIFLIFCYRFPAGLVLYWSCQNLLTILQQWLTNRAPDEPVEIVEPEAKPKKKNSSAKRKSAKFKR